MAAGLLKPRNSLWKSRCGKEILIDQKDIKRAQEIEKAVKQVDRGEGI
jgi:hypothetical protein